MTISQFSDKFRFQQLHSENKDDLALIYAIYISSFPINERRPFTQYTALLSDPSYRMQMLLMKGQPVGFFSFWLLDHFLFLEHFAIAQHCRSQGVGKTALQAFMQEQQKPFILEVEPPETGDMARRRIKFYQNLGFALNRVDHLQPAYGEDMEPVHLHLMSWPNKIDDYAAVNKVLHNSVYRRDRLKTP